jgi:hypothetical protein
MCQKRTRRHRTRCARTTIARLETSHDIQITTPRAPQRPGRNLYRTRGSRQGHEGWGCDEELRGDVLRKGCGQLGGEVVKCVKVLTFCVGGEEDDMVEGRLEGRSRG